jgi:hypothetical protein
MSLASICKTASLYAGVVSQLDASTIGSAQGTDAAESVAAEAVAETVVGPSAASQLPRAELSTLGISAAAAAAGTCSIATNQGVSKGAVQPSVCSCGREATSEGNARQHLQSSTHSCGSCNAGARTCKHVERLQCVAMT